MPVILIEKDNKKAASLFSFVPKTGGSALIKFFSGVGCRVFFHNENNSIIGLLKAPSQHFHYEFLDKIFDIDKFSFSFSVVRHPLARSKSDYLWAMRNIEDVSKAPSFDQWFSAIVDEYQKNPFVFDNHIRPQSDFIGNKIKKVYRYEDGLEAAALDVIGSMGFSVNVDRSRRFVPKSNTSEGNLRERGEVLEEKAQASPEAITKLQEFYRKDFERFYPEG